jgi:hypothetical protein
VPAFCSLQLSQLTTTTQLRPPQHPDFSWAFRTPFGISIDTPCGISPWGVSFLDFCKTRLLRFQNLLLETTDYRDAKQE